MKHIDANKVNLYISDAGWEGLKQLAYDLGYVRGVKLDDRPRGMSAFIRVLARQVFRDTRPEYLQGTGQWTTGLERARQRCVSLSGETCGLLGLLAMEHAIYPYRSQAPVVNGFRRHAMPPVLHWPGRTPRGKASAHALAGPLLDAIGVGHLSPTDALPRAPADLYQGPSKRYEYRRKMREADLSLF